MADVFVSYDRRDRELAEKVVAALTEQGLTVWWDDRITPHETWDKTIEREVDCAKRVLVLWTNNSVQSDWVRTEAGAAKESTPPKLVQARFSDCKVPLAFRLLQHVDLIGWTPKRRHSGWDRLVGWLKDAPADAAPAAAPAAPAAAPVAAPAAPAAFADLGTPAPPQEPSVSAGADEAPAETAPRIEMPKIDLPKVEIPKIEMPEIEMPDLKSGLAGIDKRILIGAGAAVGLAVVVGLFMAFSGGGGTSGGGSANGVGGEERRTLAGYLDAYQGRYAAGARAVGDDETARLADDGAHDWDVRLRGGQAYVILGACSVGCTDVDLILMDREGDQVARDVLTDDYPVVTYTPAQDGPYTIRIAMPGCGQAECIGAARLTEAP